MPVVTRPTESGSPQSRSECVEPAPASADVSPRIATPARSTTVLEQPTDSPHGGLVPALSGATADSLPNLETPIVVERPVARPELAGLYDTWEPVPASDASDIDTEVDPAPTPTTKRATALMMVCAVAIVAIVVLSAVRMAGFTGLESSADELSSRYVRELVLWVPMVAVLAVGLAAAGLVRTRQLNQ